MQTLTDKPPVTGKQTLTGKQARHLRSLAHGLDPVVMVGKDGATDGVLAATAQALLDHELVKVKLPDIERGERAVIADKIADGASCALVATIGRVAILYKRHPSTPKIDLPRR